MIDLSTNKERRPNGAALAIGALLLAVAAVVQWDASRLGSVASYARVGPATFEYVIGGFLALMGILTISSGLRADFPRWNVPELAPVFWISAGMLSQIILLKPAGFSIATGLLFALTARGFGQKPLWRSILIGIPLAFVVWIIFARLLMLSLPAGPLERLVP